jgi:hypothetical protein
LVDRRRRGGGPEPGTRSVRRGGHRLRDGRGPFGEEVAMATEVLDIQGRTEPRHSFLRNLASLDVATRQGIYRSGGFTPVERNLWASNYPEEAPIVNGEFEWIALNMADLD